MQVRGGRGRETSRQADKPAELEKRAAFFGRAVRGFWGGSRGEFLGGCFFRGKLDFGGEMWDNIGERRQNHET